MSLYRGTIVEESFKNKKILNELNIIKKYNSGDWVLYDIEIEKNKIMDLRKYINDGPWYIHFWNKNNNDEIIVVFKEKFFKIKYSDKLTWTKAVKYGENLGIPKEQLDFLINQND